MQSAWRVAEEAWEPAECMLGGGFWLVAGAIITPACGVRTYCKLKGQVTQDMWALEYLSWGDSSGQVSPSSWPLSAPSPVLAS